MYQDARSTSLRILAQTIKEDNIDINYEIEVAIKKATAVFPVSQDEILSLKEDLKKSLNITMSIKSVLLNGEDKEHIPWLNVKKTVMNWKYWNRYKRYLTEVKNWPPTVVDSIDDTTDSILELLEDPTVKGRQYDRRGLIVGYVQSGKTANYTALINKAIDSGFKLIIVLAGMHNDLRSQTQMRLDEEVLGFETSHDKLDLTSSHSNALGVGRLVGDNFYEVFPLTSRDYRGDFSTRKARSIGVQPTTTPFLLVVKKNASVLKNLLNYFRNYSPLARMNHVVGHKTVADIPLLIIDDEADQASVNTAEIYKDNGEIDENYDPSRINAYIRQIYQTFEQKAYVGYTATPFANVFINQNATTATHGQELFPKDFIINLPKPSNYVGPAEFFMLDTEKETELPLVKEIKYEENFLPIGHKKEHVPLEIPDCLLEAMYSYILATTIRRLRGQITVHNSMLIHGTRFTDVQHKVYKLVLEELRHIKNNVKNSKKQGYHYKGLQYHFYKQYCTEKLAEIRSYYPSHFDRDKRYDFTWEEIERELMSVLESIKVKEINGNSKDVLEYGEYKETGLNVIAIGGDKLSRGLTLEGLTVSYYLRASKMYDTLMQMGRWFGYRQGFLDLCRIYTTKEIKRWFRHIAEATEELRGQLEYMSKIKATPNEFLLKIQSHPQMYITSQLKMRSAREVKVSYSNELIQTTVFPTTSEEFFKRNFIAFERIINRLQEENTSNTTTEIIVRKKANKHHVWEKVKGDTVVEFLDEYQTVSSASRANSRSLAEYIRKRLEDEELVNWTVVVINNGDERFEIAGKKIGVGVKRSGIENYNKEGYTSVKTLTSSGHEFFDYTKEKYDRAQAIINANKGKKNRIAAAKEARALRDPKKALLILYPIDHCKLDNFSFKKETYPIGFAISFPESGFSHTEVDYMVNESVEQDDDLWTELD
ncbi:hypothetical protein J2S74_000733 [Evansella vedderi]|uniref:Putative endonuclease Z1 domain-containing protein n=1 Tax=Evansella vedderi TaxID=38282 RepID=A0ABT9ZRJ5_9BACI|nr:Z1 domain-containing protein [Evansella vedderi]MDQ0253361.1 hypothetical protein [Evansella vedderi]